MDQYQQHGGSGYNSNMQSQSGYPTNGGGSYNQSYGSQNSQMGYGQEYDHNSTGYQDYR